MKIFSSKFLMVAMAAILLAGLASATTVSAVCLPNPNDVPYPAGSSAPVVTTESCTIANALPVGAVITGYSWASSFDSAWDVLHTVGGSATFSFVGPGNMGNAGTVTEVASSSGVVTNSNCNAACVAAVATGAFIVTDTFQSTGTVNSLQSATFSKSFSFDYTIPSGTPEPASFAMIGGGLLALGVLARRRRA